MKALALALLVVAQSAEPSSREADRALALEALSRLGLSQPVVGEPPPPEEDPLSPAAREGRRLWRSKQCARCHEGPEAWETVERDRSCVQCHQAVRAGEIDAPPDQLEAWNKSIVHLVEVPTLNLAGRARPAWIASYLMRPHDLRRGLAESMPRLPLTADEAEKLAAYLVEDKPPSTAPVKMGDARRGLDVINAKSCGVCHAFTGTEIPIVAVQPRFVFTPSMLARAMPLAPDLRVVRERSTPAATDEWLKGRSDGRRVMPDIPLTDDERADVVAALFQAKLAAPPVVSPPARLPILPRKVRFAEVQERVFKKTCIHCHADDSADMGLGGPGNNGGFGYMGTGLVLSSYARTQAGSVDNSSGRRMSIYRPVEAGPLAGVPLLVAQLRARQLEETGGNVDGVVGMPLGLPALSPEELQLVETWVAQGRPQ